MTDPTSAQTNNAGASPNIRFCDCVYKGTLATTRPLAFSGQAARTLDP